VKFGSVTPGGFRYTREVLTPEQVGRTGKGIQIGDRVVARDGHMNTNYGAVSHGVVERVELNDNGLFRSLVYVVRLDDGTMQECWGNKVSREI